MKMYRSLYTKLVLALAILLLVTSVLYIFLTVMTTRMYLQEVNQTLNRSLANNIVQEEPLLRNKKVNQQAIKKLFHMLMVVNPAIEVYLVDENGKVLTYSAEQGKVKRNSIDINPVREFISDNIQYPVLGDDPRDQARQKVFTAAPVYYGGNLEGYLYVVLGSELYDSMAQMLQGSYVMRLSGMAIIIIMVFAILVGIIAFNLLTRRLKTLTKVIDDFKEGDLQTPVLLKKWRRSDRGDEIDRLGLVFEHMSQRIVDQIKLLQHADASHREMVANISHDLRTPMASLQGYLETLSIKDGSLSDEEKHYYLELALKHSERLGRLINELFELAMLETHDPRLHFEAFSLSELLQDVAHKFRLQADKKQLNIEADIPEHSPFVSADIGLIERVLENLIENAIKYTPAGGTIHLALVPAHNQMTTQVSDTGCGISSEDIPRIFERFYRVDERHDDMPEGTGLGLAIAERILQLHGSNIQVDSVVNRGTTFAFGLPLSVAG